VLVDPGVQGGEVGAGLVDELAMELLPEREPVLRGIADDVLLGPRDDCVELRPPWRVVRNVGGACMRTRSAPCGGAVNAV